MKTLKAGTRLICIDDTYFGKDWRPRVDEICVLVADCPNIPGYLPKVLLASGRVYDGAFLYRYEILGNKWEIKYK